MRFAAALVVFAGLALTAHGQEVATSELEVQFGAERPAGVRGLDAQP